ncbi:MAG: AgmX/PglI C-terminal domain-containing protein [Sandaracinaceae bacterium]|nr:AgmX/PglI C-terminal domain-containing protein [Sandaracinaceae bacterium]
MLRPLIGLLALASLPGCGGASPQLAPAAPASAQALGARGPTRALGGRGMSVEGLHGTLAASDVREALAPRMSELTGCFALRSMSFHHLGGQLRMSIRVSGAGGVVAAHPEDSTVGDREVERCVRRVLATVRFPRTQGGGEALVHWALSVEPASDARAPLTWDPDRVAHVVRRRGTQALAECNAASSVQVTAYVSRRGRVINVGAASSEGQADEVLDCVARRVRAWRMPAPRGVTKVTFDLRA